ncbi:MAG: glycosyltransferase [Pseudomonadota bacterium]
MRFLHAAALLRPPSGIINQMRWEHEAANELGIDWSVKLYCPQGWIEPEEFIEASPKVKAGDPAKGKPTDWFRFRYGYYQWLMSQEDNYDAFVLRYYVHDPFQLLFARRCSKPVYFVHHTLEVPELRLPGTLPAKMRAKLDDLIAVPTLRAAAGIIGVTQEIVDYETARAGISNAKTFVYPNGIKFDEDPVADKRGKIPELLFVAGGFSPWHGLDLLLDSIEKSDAEFKLHLVGNVHEPDLSRAQKDSRIVVHGRLPSAEIRRIAETCWIGLSSFGLHRNNMKEACTLKVREYLMMGLPVYAGHHDVVDNENEFVFCGEANVSSILECAKKTLAPRGAVVQSSEDNICKKRLLSMLYKDLRS